MRTRKVETVVVKMTETEFEVFGAGCPYVAHPRESIDFQYILEILGNKGWSYGGKLPDKENEFFFQRKEYDSHNKHPYR